MSQHNKRDNNVNSQKSLIPKTISINLFTSRLKKNSLKRQDSFTRKRVEVLNDMRLEFVERSSKAQFLNKIASDTSMKNIMNSPNSDIAEEQWKLKHQINPTNADYQKNLENLENLEILKSKEFNDKRTRIAPSVKRESGKNVAENAEENTFPSVLNPQKLTSNHFDMQRAVYNHVENKLKQNIDLHNDKSVNRSIIKDMHSNIHNPDRVSNPSYSRIHDSKNSIHEASTQELPLKNLMDSNKLNTKKQVIKSSKDTDYETNPKHVKMSKSRIRIARSVNTKSKHQDESVSEIRIGVPSPHNPPIAPHPSKTNNHKMSSINFPSSKNTLFGEEEPKSIKVNEILSNKDSSTPSVYNLNSLDNNPVMKAPSISSIFIKNNKSTDEHCSKKNFSSIENSISESFIENATKENVNYYYRMNQKLHERILHYTSIPEREIDPSLVKLQESMKRLLKISQTLEDRSFKLFVAKIGIQISRNDYVDKLQNIERLQEGIANPSSTNC